MSRQAQIPNSCLFPFFAAGIFRPTCCFLAVSTSLMYVRKTCSCIPGKYETEVHTPLHAFGSHLLNLQRRRTVDVTVSR
ncbi:hypothetical protein Mapa_014154 [Marchantia paleacea]|nr:hypothetical protein Mapa_014154 [Marchantia paleacea]